MTGKAAGQGRAAVEIVGEDSAEREKGRSRRREGYLLRRGEGRQFLLGYCMSPSQSDSNTAHGALRDLDLGSCNPDNPILPVRVLTLLLFITMYIF
jgi:hypothetical protein